jgi:hypothetical protein
MPVISPDSGYLTVLNLFRTDTPERQDRLLTEMRAIVDTAAFPGWISSTVHSGQEKLGTANFIQWRGKQDLEARYAGDEFKHRTVPVFSQITTSVKLLQTEVAFTGRHPSLGDLTEVAPEHGDYTVIEVFGVAPENQDDLVAVLGPGHGWLAETPGYRSHSVLRGIRARGVDGKLGIDGILSTDHSFVVTYSQWSDKETYDAFRAVPQDEWPNARRTAQAQLDALAVWREWNTYRVVHTRSAAAVAR